MGTSRIRLWDGDTFSCSRNTKRGSVAWRSRCMTIVYTSGRLPALPSPYGVLYGFSS